MGGARQRGADQVELILAPGQLWAGDEAASGPLVDRFLPLVDRFLPLVDRFLPLVDRFLPPLNPRLGTSGCWSDRTAFGCTAGLIRL